MAPTDVNYISSLHTPNTVANNYLNMESMHISSLSEELSIFDFTSNNSFKNVLYHIFRFSCIVCLYEFNLS